MTVIEGLPDDKPVEHAIHLGGDHWYVKVYEYTGDRWAGIDEYHKNAEGKWCVGWVPFDHLKRTPGPGWRLESEEPFTLSPSLQCTACPSHGFIREGVWVDA